MKVLVTGSNGQLGYDTLRILEKEKIEALGIDIKELDLTKEDDVVKFVLEYRPDVIMHNAAYTAVDKAEDNKDACMNVNYNGTLNLVNACKLVNAKMLYISTDYVFNGEKEGFYDVDDEKNPLSVYGLTKSMGEEAVKTLDKFFIVRISWVFGINGNNFIKTMLRLGNERDEVSVITDQEGSPTYTYDLAVLLVNMIKTEKYGIYHATNSDTCSWYEFAKEIFKVANMDVKVNAILTKDYKTKAIRPMNSKMSKNKLIENGFEPLPSWKDALRRFINELNEDK